jgi:hypothetical protein
MLTTNYKKTWDPNPEVHKWTADNAVDSCSTLSHYYSKFSVGEVTMIRRIAHNIAANHEMFIFVFWDVLPCKITVNKEEDAV